MTINEAIQEGRLIGVLSNGDLVYQLPARPGNSMRGGYITKNEPFEVTFTEKQHLDYLSSIAESELRCSNRADEWDEHEHTERCEFTQSELLSFNL